jgi:hypothetical protein
MKPKSSETSSSGTFPYATFLFWRAKTAQKVPLKCRSLRFGFHCVLIIITRIKSDEATWRLSCSAKQAYSHTRHKNAMLWNRKNHSPEGLKKTVTKSRANLLSVGARWEYPIWRQTLQLDWPQWDYATEHSKLRIRQNTCAICYVLYIENMQITDQRGFKKTVVWSKGNVRSDGAQRCCVIKQERYSIKYCTGRVGQHFHQKASGSWCLYCWTEIQQDRAHGEHAMKQSMHFIWRSASRI